MNAVKPLAIDLFCGLGGWTDGLLAEGWDVVGFDIEEHVYGEQRYPAQLVLQDVRTIHGKQFKHASLIVASSPCQAYSYMAMPWTRAKQIAAALRGRGEFPEGYNGARTIAEQITDDDVINENGRDGEATGDVGGIEYWRARCIECGGMCDGAENRSEAVANWNRRASSPVSQEAPGLPPGESPQRDAICDALTEALLYVGSLAHGAGERETINLRSELEIRGLARLLTTRDGHHVNWIDANTRKLWERIGTALAPNSPVISSASPLSEEALDAKRWRYFREFMTVEDDASSGGQYLFVWDDKVEATFAPGFDNTVESLVDQRIAKDARLSASAPSPEDKGSDDPDADLKNAIDGTLSSLQRLSERIERDLAARSVTEGRDPGGEA